MVLGPLVANEDSLFSVASSQIKIGLISLFGTYLIGASEIWYPWYHQVFPSAEELG